LKKSDIFPCSKASPTHSLTQGMPIFKCSCGERILVIPDLRGMNEAIKKHLKKHNSAGHPMSEDALTQEILKVLSDR